MSDQLLGKQDPKSSPACKPFLYNKSVSIQHKKNEIQLIVANFEC